MDKGFRIVRFFLSIICIIVCFHSVNCLPTGKSIPNKGKQGPGDDSRKSISNVSLKERHNATPRNLEIPNYDRHSLAMRLRRSPKSDVKPHHSPSAELQTIMNGDWHNLEPTALFKLLNTLATSKETLPEDFYGYDENEEDDPIDLVYSGKKPLDSTFIQGLSYPLKVSSPMTEPLSIMSSNMGKIYRLTDYDGDDPQPLQMHRLSKKGFPFSIFKKSHKGWTGPDAMKDMVQLPNGEIAFTPRGLHALRIQPTVLDDDLPLVIRRPIL